MNEIMLRRLLPMIDDMGNDETVDLTAGFDMPLPLSPQMLHTAGRTLSRIHILKTYSVSLIYQNREFERNVALLLVDIVPWLIAPKAWKACKDLCAAFKDYFDRGGHEDGSELLAMRYRSFSGLDLLTRK
ncbi:hypothetical protein N7517_007702 [Penicillium concentricum]|uniref:Uncharacterized protein n=1 Tax=Penicillium concentricum TaxID=293559 RepID=A0A9W9SBQ0_9EURO|nr:uncharacterized protein N7517_007702 [Penicillium concentricum]KAJ5375696.1 hypothetical protein N7517_007702 [Penicillium concentricum]